MLITDEHGREAIYDKVIFAAHSNQTLAMLKDATPEERRLLGAIPYGPNRVVLHRDLALMPKRRKVWASWNYLRSSAGEGENGCAVSYWMNRLQGIRDDHPLFVTLNPTANSIRRRCLPSIPTTTRNSTAAAWTHNCGLPASKGGTTAISPALGLDTASMKTA